MVDVVVETKILRVSNFKFTFMVLVAMVTFGVALAGPVKILQGISDFATKAWAKRAMAEGAAAEGAAAGERGDVGRDAPAQNPLPQRRPAANPSSDEARAMGAPMDETQIAVLPESNRDSDSDRMSTEEFMRRAEQLLKSQAER